MTNQIPIFKNNNFNKQDHINALLEDYYNFQGERFDFMTVNRIFEQLRVLDTYGVSPFMYFGCFISAQPQAPYTYEYQLSYMSTPDLISVPIPLLDIIQQNINQHGIENKLFSVEFDPFNVEWRSQTEFDAFMRFMEDFHMDDTRYKYYITVMWTW